MASEQKVKIKANAGTGLLGFLGASRKGKITLRDDDVLVCFKSARNRSSRLEIWPRPEDGRLKTERGLVILDGNLSENGGSFITIDEDRQVQVGYQLGEVTRTVGSGEFEEVEEHVTDPKTGLIQVQRVKREIPRVEVVGVNVWEGIDGVTTLVNEDDVSFKQIAQAHITNILKMLKQLYTFAAIQGIITAIALMCMAYVVWHAFDLELPSFGR